MNMDKTNRASCRIYNSKVEEHIQGHGHKKTQAALHAQKKYNVSELSEEQPMLDQNSEDAQLQKEMGLKESLDCSRHTTDLRVCPTSQMCEEELHAASGRAVGKQINVTDTELQDQQNMSEDKGERNPKHKEMELQNIVNVGDNSFLCLLCQVTLEGYVSVEQHIVEKKHMKNSTVPAIDGEYLRQKIVELEGGKDNIHMIATNKFRCKLCSKMLDIATVIPHVKGSLHQLKLETIEDSKGKKEKLVPQKNEVFNIQDMWKKIYKAEEGRWSNIGHISGQTFRCGPCEVMLSAYDVVAHVQASSHQKTINSEQNIQFNKSLSEFADRLWQSMHAADLTHRMYFNIDSTTILYCTSCCVKVPATAQNVVDHIRGKSHMTTVISHIMLSPHQPTVTPQRDLMDEENSPSLEATHKQEVEEESLKVVNKYVKSKEFKSSRKSQRKMCINSDEAQEAFVKALTPKEKGGIDKNDKVERAVLYRCFVCNFEVKSEELWCKHKGNKKHGKRVDKLINEGKNLIVYNCCTCGTTLLCIQSDVEKHRCGEKEIGVSSDEPKQVADKDQHLNTPDVKTSPLETDKTLEREINGTDYVPRIIVSGYPRGVGMEPLYSFFKEFGTVSFVAVTGDSAVIEFIENEAVRKALEKPLFLRESALTVKTLTQYSHQVPEPTISLHDSMFSTFASPRSFDTKVTALSRMTSYLSSPQTGRQVCQFLEASLVVLFPGCKAIPFGSRVSGLPFPESDLDIFIDTGGMYDGKFRQEAAVQELIVSITESALKELPECSHVEGVPKARTPIVKFFHKPTETQCDLAFRHGLGCENTSLLRFYMSLDPRVRPLITFLKHWASIHELTGPSSITNYALTWLVIFYLQQASALNLPAVEFLITLKSSVKKIAGWCCSFCRDKSRIPPIKSSQTLLQLLHGFFSHYYNFDFSKYVVCPLIGIPVIKHYFTNNPKNLPQAMDIYIYRIMKDRHAERFRAQSCMCVQDPFDLSHNLTKGTTPAILRKFKILCELSLNLCTKISSSF